MDNIPPASFIPRKILIGDSASARRPVNLFLVIALFLLLLSLAGFGGVYGYKRFLADAINRPCEEVDVGGNISTRQCGLIAAVALEEKNLDRDTIVLLQRLDKKLNAAGGLLAEHTTLLPVFTMLEELTLPSIQYTQFSYGAEGLSLGGQASGYEDIAVQTKIFAADRGRIKSFIFSDLNANERGDVTFNLTMTLDSAFTVYAARANN